MYKKHKLNYLTLKRLFGEFEVLFGFIANTWAILHTFEYRLFENVRGHFALRVKQALVFAINTFSNNYVFFISTYFNLSSPSLYLELTKI